MIGIGTLINTACIIVGGVLGLLFGKLLTKRHQDSLTMACGVSVLFLGIAGALEAMLTIDNNSVKSGGTMFLVVCLALGALIGETVNIEAGFERFGEWLKLKTGNAKDKSFVDGFVTASLTVCIGAMAILGSIEDGIEGNWSILAIKGVLDLIIVMVMTCSMGKGCIFSAIPVFVFEGLITIMARLVSPAITDLAINYISFVGSVLIFCVGLNLVWGKKVRVANLLPAVILAWIAAFLPIPFM